MLRRRLKEPFGKAGLIVAVVALVFAMLGGAYAATNSGGGKATASAKAKQGKQGKPGKNGTNGTNGAPGATGPVGPAGPAGVGTNGTNAEAGTPFTGTKTVGSVKCENGGVPVKSASPETAVCNGKNGTTGFTKTLPKGETELGTWSASGKPVVILEALAQEGLFTTISFNIPLAAAPTPHVIAAPTATQREHHEFPIPPAGCEGTVEEPAAEEGNLCIFSGYEENVQSLVSLPPDRSAFESLVEGLENTAGKGGALLAVQSEAAQLIDSGTWAVTAE